MAAKISRRKLAKYVANELIEKKTTIWQRLAAYLVDTRRTREAELIVRDIAATLEEKGVVIVEAVSAATLSKEIKQHISTLVAERSGAKEVHITEVIDPAVIGGVKISTPTAQYDTTIQQNINALRALKQ